MIFKSNNLYEQENHRWNSNDLVTLLGFLNDNEANISIVDNPVVIENGIKIELQSRMAKDIQHVLGIIKTEIDSGKKVYIMSIVAEETYNITNLDNWVLPTPDQLTEDMKQITYRIRYAGV